MNSKSELEIEPSWTSSSAVRLSKTCANFHSSSCKDPAAADASSPPPIISLSKEIRNANAQTNRSEWIWFFYTNFSDSGNAVTSFIIVLSNHTSIDSNEDEVTLSLKLYLWNSPSMRFLSLFLSLSLSLSLKLNLSVKWKSMRYLSRTDTHTHTHFLSLYFFSIFFFFFGWWLIRWQNENGREQRSCENIVALWGIAYLSITKRNGGNYTNRMKRESCGMEMMQLLIIDHYPVALLNNISLDKSIYI